MLAEDPIYLSEVAEWPSTDGLAGPSGMLTDGIDVGHWSRLPVLPVTTEPFSAVSEIPSAW